MSRGILLAFALPILLAASGATLKLQRATATVGLVFDVGGRGDRGFNDAAERGLTRAAGELGVRASVVQPTGDADGAMRKLVATKPSLAIGVGYSFSPLLRELAKANPTLPMVCIDDVGGETPPNLLAVRFKEEEGAFLVGALAALVVKEGPLGFVGGADIPLIRRFLAGYTAGARAVRPDVKVLSAFVSDGPAGFTQPGRAKTLALQQYDAGAGVVFHAAGASGLGVFEAARERKRLVIGVDADQRENAPGLVLTSMVKRIDNAVYDAVRDVQQGSFKGGVRELSLASGGVDYVYDEHNRALIPDAVRAKVAALRADIVAGRIVVPAR